MLPIPPPPYRNSAGRLLAILDTIKGSGSYLNWLNIKGSDECEPKHEPTFANDRLAEFREVFRELWRDIEECPRLEENQRQLFKSGIKDILDILSPRQLAQSVRRATSAEESVLKICATFLTEEGELPETSLQSIKQTIRDLSDLLTTSDISPQLRKSLQELMRLAQNAIQDFDIHGARGFRDRFATMIGVTYMTFSERRHESVVEHPGDEAALRKAGDLLQVMESTLEWLGRYSPGIKLVLDGATFMSRVSTALM